MRSNYGIIVQENNDLCLYGVNLYLDIVILRLLSHFHSIVSIVCRSYIIIYLQNKKMSRTFFYLCKKHSRLKVFCVEMAMQMREYADHTDYAHICKYGDENLIHISVE